MSEATRTRDDLLNEMFDYAADCGGSREYAEQFFNEIVAYASAEQREIDAKICDASAGLYEENGMQIPKKVATFLSERIRDGLQP